MSASAKTCTILIESCHAGSANLFNACAAYFIRSWSFDLFVFDGSKRLRFIRKYLRCVCFGSVHHSFHYQLCVKSNHWPKYHIITDDAVLVNSILLDTCHKLIQIIYIYYLGGIITYLLGIPSNMSDLLSSCEQVQRREITKLDT